MDHGGRRGRQPENALYGADPSFGRRVRTSNLLVQNQAFYRIELSRNGGPTEIRTQTVWLEARYAAR